MKKERKFLVTLNEHQLMLIADCLEDLHRFMCGQMDMFNTTSRLESKYSNELRGMLKDLKPLVTPELPYRSEYDWCGSECPNRHQQKFIAETYYLYREIVHQVINSKGEDMSWNVYRSETLRCEDSGEPIQIKEIK